MEPNSPVDNTPSGVSNSPVAFQGNQEGSVVPNRPPAAQSFNVANNLPRTFVTAPAPQPIGFSSPATAPQPTAVPATTQLEAKKDIAPTPVAAVASAAPAPPRQLHIGWIKWLAAATALTVVGLVVLAVITRPKPASEVKPTSISLPEDDNLLSSANKRVSINGLLKVNGDFILNPAKQPIKPVTGQLYFDVDDNLIYYYDGEQFINLLNQNDADSLSGGVASLQGESGDVSLQGGDGIEIDGTTISNAGVLSLGGETGDIELSAGDGIEVDGTAIFNTGVLSLAGTAHQIFVSDTTGDITLSLPQDIDAAATPNFVGVVAGSLTNSGAITIQANGTLALAASGSNIITASTNGLERLRIDAAGNIGIGQSPTLADVKLQLAGALQLVPASLPAIDSTHNGTVYFDPDGGGAGVGKFKIIEDGVAKILCNTTDQGCGVAGGGGVSDLQGAYNGGNIINTTNNRDLMFNLANTAVDSNFVVNVTTGSTGKFKVQNSGTDTFTVDGMGTVTAATSFLSSNFDTPAAGALSIGGTSASSVTVGNTAAALTLQGSSASKFTATSGANTTTVDFAAPSANVILRMPALTAGTYNICTDSGNCSGIGATLQTAYNNSIGGSTAEIVLDTTRGAMTVRDAVSPIGGNLLEVQNNAGSSSYFSVNSAGIGVTGAATTSGNINTTGGSLQTGGLTRVDNSGNLTNIGSVTLAGAISGGTSITGSGAINSTSGTIQTGSTDRITNGGNLVNIGTITTSGLINSQTIGAVTNFTGTVTVQGSSALTLGTASANTGSIIFKGSGGANTVTLTGLNSPGANRVVTLPDATGTICLDSGNCLGGGGGGANTALSNLTNVAVNTSLLSGAATIDLGSGTNPFRDLYLGGTTTNNFKFTGTATGARTITIPDTTGTICLSTGNCIGGPSGGANTSLSNLTGVAINTSLLPAAAGAQNLGSSSLPFGQLFLSGTSGGPASNNFTFTGAATGARTLTLPDASGTLAVSASGNINLSATGNITLTGQVPVANGGTGLGSLTSNGVLYGNGSSNVQVTSAGTPGQCLTVNGSNVPVFGSCAGGGSGVTLQAAYNNSTSPEIVLNPTNGALTLRDAASPIGANLLEVQNNAGGTTFFAVSSSGTSTTGTQTASSNINSTGGTIQTASTDRITNGGNLVNIGSVSTSGTINSQTISAAASFTGTVTAATSFLAPTFDTASGVALTVGGSTASSTTVGRTAAALTLQGSSSSKFTATSGANTTTLDFASPTANTTLRLPALSAGTYAICTDSGNCNGVGATLQTAYNNSTTPEIVLNGTNGAVTVRDNATPIGTNLLEVQNNGGGSTYFAVTSSGISVTGTASASSSINSSGGTIQTASTDRISNAGNLVNIGSLTLSGAISGGTTFSGSGNINTSGGALQTNSTTRVDNSGNLTNIGNITGSSGVTLQATASTLALTATGANIITATTNGTEALRINSSQNFGVGTSTITERLTVNGNIRLSGAGNVSTTSGDLTLQSASTGNINIGTSDTTGQLLVLDTKTGSGDPTGVNGGIYYNSNTARFRCFQNSGWTDCVGNGVDLQAAYANSSTPATITTTASSKTILFKAGSGFDSASLFQVQKDGGAALLTVDSSNSKLIVGSATSDATQVLLQVDSFSTFGGSASCGASTNQGALYYNTDSNSASLRACVDGEWGDLTSTTDLGLLTFGVVPDSGNDPGDLASIGSVGVTGPCKVSYLSATSVRVAPCVAYSQNRKVIIPQTDLNTGMTSGPEYQHVCLTGTDQQPALGSSNSTQNAGLPTFSATAPILCLATVKSNNSDGNVHTIYDVRTFTTTQKVLVTIYNVNAFPGFAAKASTSVAGAVTAPGASNGDTDLRGIVVATSGTGSSTAINGIIAIGGPAFVVATGTSSIGQYVRTAGSPDPAGYTNSTGTIPGNYASLGIAQRSIDTGCSSSANCQFSQLIDVNIR